MDSNKALAFLSWLVFVLAIGTSVVIGFPAQRKEAAGNNDAKVDMESANIMTEFSFRKLLTNINS